MKIICLVAYILLNLAFSFNLADASACTDSKECNNGLCILSKCVCTSGYTNFNGSICTYKQKEKLTAFLLSFFIGPTGADWFYLACGNRNYIVGGVFKLLTGFFFIGGMCFLCCSALCTGLAFFQFEGKRFFQIGGMVFGVFITFLMVLCSLANSIWVLVDIIRIATGSFNDGNGISLKDWWWWTLILTK